MPKTYDEFRAEFEYSKDLPTPVKGDNGPRFADEVAAPVVQWRARWRRSRPRTGRNGRQAAKVSQCPPLCCLSPWQPMPSCSIG
jgi:hypothetical protein